MTNDPRKVWSYLTRSAGLADAAKFSCYARRELAVARGKIMWGLFDAGTNIINEDWDNLIILDACRFDAFQNNYRGYDLEGWLKNRTSVAATTKDFLRRTLDGGQFLDTVVVAANAHWENTDAEFCDIIAQYHGHREPLFPEDYEEPNTAMLPGKTAELTRRAASRYPNKKIIAHFMPPHSPYLGPTGRRHYDKNEVWLYKVQRGEISIDDLRSMYAENINIILPIVADLVGDLNGKTIITADHGELLGEHGMVAHPSEVYVPELIKVPWFEIPYEERKEITAAQTGTNVGEREQSIEEQLRILGYK